jgi:peptidoglycan lytic transglycosylase
MYILKSFLLLFVSLLVLASCSKYITETGDASYYGKGDKYNGRQTADGETFDTYDYTAAHKTIAFNTIVWVTNLDNGKTTKVRINDRGPYAKNRIIDLSYAAAKKIDMVRSGTARVKIRYKKKKRIK